MEEKIKSKVIKSGYINQYTQLTKQELRTIWYKERYKRENPSWDDTLVYLSKKFQELVPSESRVLDAGCGNGNYVIDENQSKISKVIGVDISREYVKNNISIDTMIESKLEKLPFDDAAFDCCTSLWVLEHVEDPQKAFKEISRVLKPGGYFFFATPNKYYLPIFLLDKIRSNKLNWFLNKVLFGRTESDIFPTFYRANTVNDISLMIKNDFKIEELRLNADVSYTSFDSFSYLLSTLILKNWVPFRDLFKPHIIGVLRKI